MTGKIWYQTHHVRKRQKLLRRRRHKVSSVSIWPIAGRSWRTNKKCPNTVLPILRWYMEWKTSFRSQMTKNRCDAVAKDAKLLISNLKLPKSVAKKDYCSVARNNMKQFGHRLKTHSFTFCCIGNHLKHGARVQEDERYKSMWELIWRRKTMSVYNDAKLLWFSPKWYNTTASSLVLRKMILTKSSEGKVQRRWRGINTKILEVAGFDKLTWHTVGNKLFGLETM